MKQYKTHKIADIFPMMSDEELHALIADIETNGQREPIVIYKDMILDGRNRYRACRKLNIEPKTIEYTGDDYDAVNFVMSLNATRRHLTASQLAAVAVKVLPMIEAAAKARHEENRKKQKNANGELIPRWEGWRDRDHLRAREAVAKTVGKVSGRYIDQAKNILASSPELFDKIAGGELTVTKATAQLRQEKEAEARSLAVGSLDIRKGDFKTVLSDVYGIDAIITDPPYPEEFLSCFSELGEFAKTHLKENGFIAVYSGQYHIPEVLRRLSEHLTYVWTFCLYHAGQTQLVSGVNIMCGWKPVFIFSRGRKKMRFSTRDVIESLKREKGSHVWQQSESGVKPLIELLAEPGGLIVDPFAGSGTFLKVAEELKYKAIGAENDSARRDEHSTEFGLWLREQEKIDSCRGFITSNLDYIWKSENNGKWMLIEEKRCMACMPDPQKKVFKTLTAAVRKARDPNFKGFHLIQFSNTNPDDGLIFIDGIQRSKEYLIRFLRFETMETI